MELNISLLTNIPNIYQLYAIFILLKVMKHDVIWEGL